jgi:sulfotransferase family protein
VLGYRTLHFPADDRSRKELMRLLAGGGDRLRLPILERFDAATDTPVCASFEALDAGYPGSKFILTIRDKQAWLESCRGFWTAGVEPFLIEHADDDNPFAAYVRAISEALYGTPTFDREQFSRAYDDYHQRVRGHFRDRPDDLLTLDICGGDGWAPLCRFLNLRPPGKPFPWEARQR